MPSGCIIKELRFNDGTRIALPADAIVVIVGPNNAGKSRLLMDLLAMVADEDERGVVANDIKVSSRTTLPELISFFGGHLAVTPGSHSDKYYKDPKDERGGLVHEKDMSHAVETGRGYGAVVGVVVQWLQTGARLGIVYPPPNINALRDPIAHPIQALHLSESLTATLSDAFRHAFNVGLVVHHTDGPKISLRVADEPNSLTSAQRTGETYRRWITDQPSLHRQGDGMRSFAGTLLHALAAPYYVLCIDEPEAFLHPPQAKLLGSILTTQRLPERQIFIATHSTDLLKGIIDTGDPSTVVIRITRDLVKGVNPVAQLGSNEIRKLWTDALVRHSNALDGLFHERTIICDGDGDCRFYSSMLDCVAPHRRDVMFLAAGGKQKAPKVARAFNALRVAVSIIADIDVLNSVDVFRDTIESLGGVWSDYEADWKAVNGAMAGLPNAPALVDVQRKAKEIFDANQDKHLLEGTADKIKELVRFTSKWDALKRIGITELPAGDAQLAAKRLIERAQAIGLYIVEEGELESFDRTIANRNKAEWLQAVLEKDLANAEELEAARRFARKYAVGASAAPLPKRARTAAVTPDSESTTLATAKPVTPPVDTRPSGLRAWLSTILWVLLVVLAALAGYLTRH